MTEVKRTLVDDLRAAMAEENDEIDPAGPTMAIALKPFLDFLVYLNDTGNLDESDPRIVELEADIGNMLGSVTQIAHEALRRMERGL